MEQIKLSEDANTVVKPLEESKRDKKLPSREMIFSQPALLVYVTAVLLGLVTGGGVFLVQNRGTARVQGRRLEVVKTDKEEGVKDAASFKDTATGKLVTNDGKITEEGTHILVRGDTSQNAYLTSSVVDLSKYEGKHVQVWGETYRGQKAGWLLNVGRIKIVE